MGITPAYAGKRAVSKISACPHRDHPRVCGEKFPRFLLCVVDSRITPAYAGKRDGQHALRFLPQDHPRVCGEKAIVLAHQVLKVGSPPRMRGKEKMEGEQNHQDRITPAYAGKRKVWNEWFRDEKDHPRVCGEKNLSVFP